MANGLPVKDIVIYFPVEIPDAHPELYNMGATAFAYISLRPDAFRLNSTGGGVPSISQTQQIQVWSWIEYSTSCKSNGFSHAWIEANELKYLQRHHFEIHLILHSTCGRLFALFLFIIPRLGYGVITDLRGRTRIPPFQI